MLYVCERKITELLDCNEFPKKKRKKERKCDVGERMLSDMSTRREMKSFIEWKRENETVKDSLDFLLFLSMFYRECNYYWNCRRKRRIKRIVIVIFLLFQIRREDFRTLSRAGISSTSSGFRARSF